MKSNPLTPLTRRLFLVPLFFLTPRLVVAAEEGGNPFFTVDPGMVVWTWITFFIVLLLLVKFAWKPILKGLEDRENRIQGALEEAERVEREAKAIGEKNQQVLQQAHSDAKQLIEDARSAALRVRLEIEEKGREEARVMMEKARRSFQQEKNAAVEALKKQSAQLAIHIAQKLIEANLDDDKNRALAEKQLSEMEKF